MTGFVFVIIFGLSSSLLSCEGQIISPPDGTKLTILPGSSENLTWNYVEDPPNFAGRSWFFTSTDGSYSSELFAQITKFRVEIDKTVLPGIAITKPSTLSLNNVSQSYDGTYQFSLKIGIQPEVSSDVRVFIAKKPTVTINCSTPTTVNEGGDVICLCRGEGGNPPANVTWSKDGVQIGGIGTENKTFILNANVTHSGIYKCKAQSYDHPDCIDEKNITLVVKPKSAKPRDTTMKIEPSQTNVGEPVVITCFSEGVPDPHFIITHNDTNFRTTDNSHKICKVQKSQGGTYTCIAINELGRDFATGNLDVTGGEVEPTTSEAESTTFQPKTLIATTTKTGKTSSNDASSKTEWYIVVVSLLSGIIIGILLSYVVWCSHRRWSRNKKQKRNSEPQTTEADPTYQELDLTKMNKEDNYQSLTVNAANNDAANEDNSTYAQLTKTRDVESNYQSLT